jgi:glycerol kinase
VAPQSGLTIICAAATASLSALRATLARTVPDNGGCYIVPAFSGLFAPHWRSEARGVIVDAMNADSVELKQLEVDGGTTADNLLMQFLADVLDVPVVRPIVVETVSLGAAYAAGPRRRLLARHGGAARHGPGTAQARV